MFTVSVAVTLIASAPRARQQYLGQAARCRANYNVGGSGLQRGGATYNVRLTTSASIEVITIQGPVRMRQPSAFSGAPPLRL